MSRMQFGKNDKPMNSRGGKPLDAALVEASYRGHRNFQFSQFGWALMLLCFALQTGDSLFRLLHGQRKTVPAIAHRDSAPQGSYAFSSDHDRRRRTLDRTRVGRHVAERSEGTVMLRMLHRPERTHGTQSIVHALAASLHRNTERLELRFQPAGAHSDNEAASGNNVDTRQLLRENCRTT